MDFNADIHSHAHGEHKEPVFSPRTLHPQRLIYENFCHVFLLQEGSSKLTSAGEVVNLIGPAAAFLPANPKFDLKLAAGSNSYLIGGSPDLLVDAIGNKAESLLLRIFTERTAVIPDLPEHRLQETEALTSSFISEICDPKRGSWMALSAYFRLILMSIWRSGAGDRQDEHALGEITTILQDFRYLVELHFREHWQISNYIEEIGITHDRLHAICTRTLNKSPLQLVHQRLVQEACMRLERSGSSIQEISNSLGFSDATNFSHFFKRKTGYPPARYRSLQRSHSHNLTEVNAGGFADWP